MDDSSAPPVRNSSRTTTIYVKRRACDECRSRKLACSKEADGCARCKKEDIDCHYSAQKPMGRPRKRASHSHSTEAAAAPVNVQDERYIDQAVSYAEPQIAVAHVQDAARDDDASMYRDTALLIDPSLSYGAEMPMADMSFLDFLGSDFMLNQPCNTNTDKVAPTVPLVSTSWPTNLYDISLNNNNDAHHEAPGGSTSLTNPSLSSQAASSPTGPSTSQPTPDPLQPASCSCLANLYLALDAIARLPTDVIPALRTARTAAHTAHDALRCDVCCPPIHKTMKMGASAFQNTMMLGALLPSIADAYHQILGLVDAEATRAIVTHAPLTFALSAYGGTWGTLLMPSSSVSGGRSNDQDDVSDNDNVDDNKVMEPAAWRQSVRSLLKIDVYGVNMPGCDGKAQFRQIGLRDLVAEMDEKSRVRHADIDALIDAGLPAPTGMNGLPAHHSHGKEPHCRHVIQLAREAVENLNIA